MVIVETIYSDALEMERDIYIFLPPNYERHDRKTYPVLYMQDGQNLFSEYGGDLPRWNIDLTAEEMIRRKEIWDIIVVGIANSEWREYEYTPTVDPLEDAGGYADQYLDFLINDVKRFIDENFRVRPFRENTGIGGSSLGGLLAFYAAIRYPEYFSKIAAISPSLWWDNHVLLEMAENWDVDPRDMKIWIDMGLYEGEGDDEDETDEGDETDEAENEETPTPIEETRALCDILKSKGFRRGRNLKYFEDYEGFHNEFSWRARTGLVLKFLFGRGRKR